MQDGPSHNFAAFLTMLCGVLLAFGLLSQVGRRSTLVETLQTTLGEPSPQVAMTPARSAAKSDEFAREKTLMRIGAVPVENAYSAMQPSADREIYANRVLLSASAYPAARETDERENGARYYQVQDGDTLFRIAKKFYGGGDRWRQIWRANDLDPQKPLTVGQKLLIPAR
ncbi:MAG: LysM peptidoglycan-binding domain-containing protein [Planctomycetota bacterium]|jgi:nucleoid-associated protein YgaU|nr:LysM peptidoglycan-binding domain-containing protein [Planctomycetota bacterium]